MRNRLYNYNYRWPPIQEWEDKQTGKVDKSKVNVVTNNAGFNAIDADSAEYVMGEFINLTFPLLVSAT